MPRIQQELNRRGRKLLRPKELPTWWSGFAGVLVVVVVLYASWNLIEGETQGVTVTVPASATQPIATIEIETSAPGVSVVTTTPASTSSPTSIYTGALVEIATYGSSSAKIPQGALEAALANAKGPSGVVVESKLVDAGATSFIIDVTVDPDGGGVAVAAVARVKIEVVDGTFLATRVN